MQPLKEYSSSLNISVAGLDLVLHRHSNLEELWNQMTEEEFTSDERIPYWTELWPASLVLSDWLKQNSERIKNTNCLDLGCGLGLTALVAASCKANVIGMDYEKEALIYAKKNAIENGLDTVTWTAMDWRYPAVKKQSLDYLWGGDIMYERRFVQPVLDFLSYSLKPNAKAWLAEPSREEIFALFRHSLDRAGWQYKIVHTQKIPAIYAQAVPVSVRLWELGKKL
ncbi:class I SAM-dependent methyltransferase [Desulfovibrio litoralis]|uniref:Lysine methyltransferase n=1 Tax=Desulfovibrio litoralis DSM 11393 TaxID=1121455 RepID=A0A1M7TFS8_9BACT|nr:methyltransferase domain-containing protein [Desulfovibrio litoralis]SHN69604.1 Lysine methyltransferase [Desulfovibrio litoralis DSM 11393]